MAVVAVRSTPWFTLLLFAGSLVIWGIVLYFFRDPERKVVDEPGLVIGPADGVVVSIEKMFDDKHLQADVIRISMFLSVWDVHVQRVPLGGKVLDVEFKPGKYLRAILPDASEVNEYIAMNAGDRVRPGMCQTNLRDHGAANVSTLPTPEMYLKTGVRYGLIKFGSRVDLFLPPGCSESSSRWAIRSRVA